MENDIGTYKILKFIKILVAIVGIGIVLTIVTFALTIATLVKVNKGFDNIPDDGITTTTGTTERTSPSASSGTNVPLTTTISGTNLPSSTTTTDQLLDNATLSTTILIGDVMHHLNELQRIATEQNGTRAIGTTGFNETLDYIESHLRSNTNYTVTKTFFPVRQFTLLRDPIFISSINGNIQNHTYVKNQSIGDFTHVRYSAPSDFSDYVEISVIPNEGCTDQDWQDASSSPAGKVALVKRGDCTFIDKATLASKYNVTALLIYNNGQSNGGVQPASISLGQSNEVVALSLSLTLGEQLAAAAQDPSMNVSVFFDIAVRNDPPMSVGNICADTQSGNPNQTIVIGSHSDSVPEGPGINDNGSGSAANLGLAIALARLFQTSTYAKYKYRVRFCWWGAEEVGLLGSIDHVNKAKNSTIVGERLQDYLINLNYDMLASPNYIFGIYDGSTANNDTPAIALPGSNKMTALFRDWFDKQNLPWDYTDFSGRSDYGPFLAEGIVAGGLFTGGDGTKSQEERDRYDRILGQGLGGIAGATYDPCYHKACDSIQNINLFAYDKMVQAAAYVLEYLAQLDDLETWLYPNRTRTTHFDIEENNKNKIL